MFDFFLASLPILFILLVNLMIKIVPWVKDQFDIVTGGTYSELHDNYSIIFAHMHENPDQWKFNRDSARFPKSGGAAIISISKENDNPKMQISIDHINEGRHYPMKAYFDQLFRKEIGHQFNEQSRFKTSQVLFPGQDVILISDESKKNLNNDFITSLEQLNKTLEYS